MRDLPTRLLTGGTVGQPLAVLQSPIKHKKSMKPRINVFYNVLNCLPKNSFNFMSKYKESTISKLDKTLATVVTEQKMRIT